MSSSLLHVVWKFINPKRYLIAKVGDFNRGIYLALFFDSMAVVTHYNWGYSAVRATMASMGLSVTR